MVYGILVPQTGIEPAPLAVKVRGPNHWTAREFPILDYYFHKKSKLLEFKSELSKMLLVTSAI